MRQELSKHIGKLLFKVERLSIPDLGSFELSPAPALVDQVQGQVSAPAMQITFNSNLVLDDGILADFLVTEKSWTVSEAQSWIAQEVAAIQESLDRREIVELPGVGRFFRNFEGRLQFVTDNINYNLQSFGLQAVNAQPIARSVSEKMKVPGVKIPPPVAPKPSTSQTISHWFQKNLFWLLGLTLLLLSLVIYLGFLQADDPVQTDPVAQEVPKERLNASPSKQSNDENTLEPGVATDSQEELPTTPELPESNDSEPIDTEAPTLAPEEHTAVIAVGLFGNPENVQSMLQKLAGQGFSPYSAPEGKNTRVGVNVRYEEESELRKVLRDIKRLYTESAFVIYKDGKRLR